MIWDNAAVDPDTIVVSFDGKRRDVAQWMIVRMSFSLETNQLQLAVAANHRGAQSPRYRGHGDEENYFVPYHGELDCYLAADRNTSACRPMPPLDRHRKLLFFYRMTF
jgi:hypothetical protein